MRMTTDNPYQDMTEMKEFVGTDAMRSLISAEPSLLMLLTRFGISLGFGDKTVAEVCGECGIDSVTFLAVANFTTGRHWSGDGIDLASMTAYLKNAHAYFLDFILPMIRRKLIGAIDCSATDGLGFLILRFYDEYVVEVKKHMEFENRTVFPYVDGLVSGEAAPGFSIDKFASRHTHIAPKLKELKDIIVCYYPENGNDLLVSTLYDIITCERDLHMHCLAEDRLFVPAVRRREAEVQKLMQEASAVQQSEADLPEQDKLSELSEREKEIICNIAKGLSNKEIADRLCLSVHTVTTHRRNISNKLQIHSPAGLAIFAIVNHLLPLTEVAEIQKR